MVAAVRIGSGTRSGTRWVAKFARSGWCRPHQASRLQTGIGARSTHLLFFVLLPKLDVVGSSPIARSLEVSKSQPVPVAGIRTGPGDFLLGPVPGPVGELIFAAKRVRCSGVRAARRASRSTECDANRERKSAKRVRRPRLAVATWVISRIARFRPVSKRAADSSNRPRSSV